MTICSIKHISALDCFVESDSSPNSTSENDRVRNKENIRYRQPELLRALYNRTYARLVRPPHGLLRSKATKTAAQSSI